MVDVVTAATCPCQNTECESLVSSAHYPCLTCNADDTGVRVQKATAMTPCLTVLCVTVASSTRIASIAADLPALLVTLHHTYKIFPSGKRRRLAQILFVDGEFIPPSNEMTRTLGVRILTLIALKVLYISGMSAATFLAITLLRCVSVLQRSLSAQFS